MDKHGFAEDQAGFVFDTSQNKLFSLRLGKPILHAIIDLAFSMLGWVRPLGDESIVCVCVCVCVKCANRRFVGAVLARLVLIYRRHAFVARSKARFQSVVCA